MSTAGAGGSGATGGSGKFLRDAGALKLAGSVNQIGQLASAVALAFLLGARDQGLYVSAVALHAFGHCLIHVGVPQVTASQISANVARESWDKVASWIAFLAKAHLGFAVLLVAVGFACFPWIAETWLGDRRIGVWGSWLCLGAVLEVPRDVARVALQGTRRMGLLARIENAQEVVRFFLIVVGALIAGGPAGAVIGSLAATATSSLMAISIYREARGDGGAPLPAVGDVLGRLRDVPLRRGLRQGVRIALMKNAGTLTLSVLPRLLVQGLAGPRMVAYFHIAHRLMSVPFVISTAVSRTALPAMAEQVGRRDLPAYRRLFVRASLGTGLGISAALALGLLFVPDLVRVGFPDDYVEPVTRFSWILALGTALTAFGCCTEAFFVTANQVRALYTLAVVGLLVAIPAAAYLVWAVEVTGPAWAVVVVHSWTLVELSYALWFLRPRPGAPLPWEA